MHEIWNAHFRSIYEQGQPTDLIPTHLEMVQTRKNQIIINCFQKLYKVSRLW